MRTTTRSLLLLAAVACLATLCPPSKADRIEAVKGKQYKLTKRHGPWMIMVATFNKPPAGSRSEGLTPEQAADELVFELRRKGIPAYSYRAEEKTREEVVQTVNRRTQEQRTGKIRLQTDGICVLAGNYPASDDGVAQKTLKYLKKFQPAFLQEVDAQGETGQGEVIKRLKNGGIYRTTPNHPGPLSGAFMTTNPILSEDELASRTRDPLILQLNSGSEYSLMDNPAKYTVVVATFQGKSQTLAAAEASDKKLEVSPALDEAASRAWELCSALRRAKSFGYNREFDAYVYHDRYSSIVTVGGFDSPRDPRIKEVQNTFGAKVAAVNDDGSPRSIGAEIFAVPKPTPGKQPTKTWIFDPFPQLLPVPR